MDRGKRSMCLRPLSILLVFMAASALACTSSPETSTARTTVQVKPSAFIGFAPQPAIDMATEVGIARSPKIAALVREQLGTSESTNELLAGLEVSAEAEASLLRFDYTHPDPATAEELSEAFAEAYIENRNQVEADKAMLQSQPIRDELSELEKEVPRLERKISHLDSRSPGWARMNVLLSNAYNRQSYLKQQMIPYEAFLPDMAEIVGEARAI